MSYAYTQPCQWAKDLEGLQYRTEHCPAAESTPLVLIRWVNWSILISSITPAVVSMVTYQWYVPDWSPSWGTPCISHPDLPPVSSRRPVVALDQLASLHHPVCLISLSAKVVYNIYLSIIDRMINHPLTTSQLCRIAVSDKNYMIKSRLDLVDHQVLLSLNMQKALNTGSIVGLRSLSDIQVLRQYVIALTGNSCDRFWDISMSKY